MPLHRRRSLQALAITQSIVGIALAAQPHRVVAAVGLTDRPPPIFILRVLGVRQVLQGAAQLRSPTATSAFAGAAIDAAHALSLAPIVAFDPRNRRAAVISAAVALAMAIIGGLIPGRP
ncbi:MAG: hypothetical protein JWM76_2152 [Pseudonocardiales bacterium]|nr:hypothetical protein [Pseudonocardiales bacterium]